MSSGSILTPPLYIAMLITWLIKRKADFIMIFLIIKIRSASVATVYYIEITLTNQNGVYIEAV